MSSIGRREISINQISEIIRLSERGKFRSEIAKCTKLSENTVYRWQKKFDLI